LSARDERRTSSHTKEKNCEKQGSCHSSLHTRIPWNRMRHYIPRKLDSSAHVIWIVRFVVRPIVRHLKLGGGSEKGLKVG
jgi:hypothetical protein